MMEMCSEEAETTLPLIATPVQPAAPKREITCAQDQLFIPQNKANSRRHKKDRKKSILDRLVLMRLNKNQESSHRRAAEESKDNVEVWNEKTDTLEGSTATELVGKGAMGGSNTFGKKNKRKRGKSCQGSILKNVKSEPESEEADTNNVTLKRCAAQEDLITDSNYDWSVDDGGSFIKQERMDVDDDDKEKDSSRLSQESAIIGGRFQALNAKPKVFKTSGKLFGMMSKMEDRKKHTCGECGRCFNQLRVLTVHQQMHTVRRNPLNTNDEKGSTEHASKAPDLSKQDEPCLRVAAKSSCEKHVSCVEEEKETSLLRNYLQEVSEQHVKGANHVEASLKKRRELHHEEPCSDQKGYVCKACGKVFSLPSSLSRHQVVHTGEKPFACKFCGKRFGQKASRQRHEKTHGRILSYMCNECGDEPCKHVAAESSCEKHESCVEKEKEKTLMRNCLQEVAEQHVKGANHVEVFPKKRTKLHHEEPCSEQKRYVCKACGKVFSLPSSLRRHQVVHTGEKPFACKSCGKRFSQKASRQRHEQKHESCVDEEKDATLSGNYVQEVSEQHDKKGYVCKTCGKVFSLPSSLRRHQVVHTGEKPFACKFCGKRFGQKSTRQRHEQTHGRIRTYMSNKCGDGISSPKQLERHARENHQGSTKKLDLPSIKIILKLSKPNGIKVVGKEEPKDSGSDEGQNEVPSSSKAHKSHMLQSQEPKEYTCHVCEKAFNQRSHLLRHNLSHTGEKPFKCKECGKGFAQKSTCVRHERNHSGELPFICTECGNSFAQKSGLQTHRLIHTGEKPYKCHFCECRFSQKTSCKRHERIHTGEKPYICQQCGKAFAQSTSLERHVKTHLKVKPLDGEEKKVIK